ncbi:MAG: hypothetical protein ACUVWP_04505 [bacterium]
MRIPSVNKILSDERLKSYIDKYGSGVIVNSIRTALFDIKKSKEISGDIVDKIVEVIDRLLFQRHIINATGDPLSNLIVNEPMKLVVQRNNIVDKRDISDSLKSISENMFNGRQILFLNNLSSALLMIKSKFFGDEKIGALIATRDIFRLNGFEIEDAIKGAGYELVEVGCSNKVHLRDYENASKSYKDNPIGVIITTSSPRIEFSGFIKSTDIEEIGNLAKGENVIHIYIVSDSLPSLPVQGLIKDEFILSSLIKRVEGFIITRTSGLISVFDSILLINRKDSKDLDISNVRYSNLMVDEVRLINIISGLYNYYNNDIVEKNFVLRCLNRDREELKTAIDKVKISFKKIDRRVDVLEDSKFIFGQKRCRFYIPIRNKELQIKLGQLGVIFGYECGKCIFDVRCVFNDDIDYLMRRI